MPSLSRKTLYFISFHWRNEWLDLDFRWKQTETKAQLLLQQLLPILCMYANDYILLRIILRSIKSVNLLIKICWLVAMTEWNHIILSGVAWHSSSSSSGSIQSSIGVCVVAVVAAAAVFLWFPFRLHLVWYIFFGFILLLFPSGLWR